MSTFQKVQRFTSQLHEDLGWWWFRVRHGIWKDLSDEQLNSILPDAQADAIFEDAYLHAYANPDRKGCPGQEILRGLATKELGISHPARVHITRCSPCFQEFRSVEKALGIRHRHNEYMFVESDQSDATTKTSQKIRSAKTD